MSQIQGQLKRQDPRVSVRSRALITHENFLHRVQVLNISVTGIFLEHLPFIPANSQLDLILELPLIPYLGELPLEELHRTIAAGFTVTAFPVQTTISRKVEIFNNLDQLFKLGVGLRFKRVGAENQQLLDNFVINMVKNTHTLLRLIQQARPAQLEVILELAHGLGYPSGLKYSELHLKVLKDYQALKLVAAF